MSRRRAAALGLVCLLLLAGCSVAGDPLGRGATASPTLTPAPVPSETPPPRGTAAPPAPLRADATPGVDAWALAGRHAETLDGRSYTWTLRREVRVYHGGPPPTTRTTLLTVRVADATTYRVDRHAPGANGTWRNATVAYAADGWVHRRGVGPNATVATGPVERRRGGEGPVADRAESVVARYLAARRVAVVQYSGEERRYLLRGRGAPPGSGNVSGYRVAALVEPAGRVTALRAAWREPNRFVEVSYRYRAVGNTTVTPPPWAVDIAAGSLSTAPPGSLPLQPPSTSPRPGTVTPAGAASGGTTTPATPAPGTATTTTPATPTPSGASDPGPDAVNASTGGGSSGNGESSGDGLPPGVWDWPDWASERALDDAPGDDSPGFGY